ncbi:M48 family metalloprotease [Streptomyces sp. NPDC059382]|uniref:M48 family metalloprotease n=1 Tax=Streptomyces sp. NPDC059382 TaxID=3346816 RepID=UPI0036BF1826
MTGRTAAPRPTGRTAAALRLLRSPSGSRYVLLVGVLLLAGTFAGQLAHNQFFGISWAETQDRCFSEAQHRYPAPKTEKEPDTDVLVRHQWQMRCARPVAERKAAVSLTGSAAVLVLGAAGLWLLPRWALRRAGPLDPAPAGAQELADQAYKDLRGRSRPRVAQAAEGWEEPFTAGAPGAPIVVLPAGFAALEAERAEAIIRHEVAHVAAGDVRLVWLTRSALGAAVAVLVVPPISLAVQAWGKGRALRDVLANPFWGAYAGRSLLLLALVLTASQLVLRSREHEADILSVTGWSRTGLTAVLAAAERTERITAAAQGWWSAPGGPRSLLSNHPRPGWRLAVLQPPRPYLGPAWQDAAVTGLFGAVTFDLVGQLAQGGFAGTPLMSYVTLTPALVAGLLIALAWGVHVWQGAWHDREAPPVPWRALAALGAGTALGFLGRLGDSGLSLTAVSSPSLTWNLVAVVTPAVCLAAALSAVLARSCVLADSVTGRHRKECQGLFIAAVVVNALLFVGALRAAQELALITQARPRDPWFWLTFEGIHSPHSGTDAVTVALLALLALGWGLRRNLAARTGTGSATGSARHLVLPFTVALATAVGTLGARWLSRHTQAREGFNPTVQYDSMAAAAAGLVCCLAVCSVRGRAGLAPALWAAPLATVLTTGALWGIDARPLEPHAVGALFSYPLAQLAVLGGLAVLPVALLPARRPGPTAWFLIPCLGAYSAALLTAALVRTDAFLYHFSL